MDADDIMPTDDIYDQKTIPLYEMVKITIFMAYRETMYYYGLYILKRRVRDFDRFCAKLNILYTFIRPKIENIDKNPYLKDLEANLTNFNKRVDENTAIKSFLYIGMILEKDIGLTKITFNDIKPKRAFDYRKK